MSVPGKRGRRPPRYRFGHPYRTVTYAEEHGVGFFRRVVKIAPRKGPFRRKDRRAPGKPR